MNLDKIDKLLVVVENGTFTYRDVQHTWDSEIWPKIEFAYDGSLDAAQWLCEELLGGKWGLVFNTRKNWASISLDDYPVLEEASGFFGTYSENCGRAALIVVLKAYRWKLQQEGVGYVR